MNSNNNIDLGFEAHQRGDYQLALNFYEQALLISPFDAEALSLKGSVLSLLNKINEAEAALKKAVEIEPSASGFWLNLADHYVRNAKISEGCQLIVDNVSAENKNKQIWQFLYQAGLKSENTDYSVLGLNRLLDIEFDFNVLISLSQLLVRTNQFEQAIDILKRYQVECTNQHAYWHALCWLLNNERRWNELKTSAQEWLRYFKDNNDAYRFLATANFETGLFHKAIALYEQKLLTEDALSLQGSLSSNAKDDLVNFIDICVAALELNKAKGAISKAADCEINSPIIINAQVQLAIFKGDINIAQQLCQNCISEFPDYYPIFVQMARIAPEQINVQEIQRIIDYISLNRADSDSLAFVLGHYYQAKQDADNAWKWYREANRLREKRNAERGVVYVQSDAVKFEKSVLELDSKIKTVSLPSEAEFFTPVFILGMPRSGSTLLEGLLAQHPAICKTGERIEFPNFAWHLADSHTSQEKLREELCEFRRYYQDNSMQENATYSCFIDKNPSNYLCVGLIKSIFPNAVIVNIKRSPIETIWSIYRHEFSHLWSFATSVENIAHQYAIYERLMSEWEKRYPGIISVQYEQFVERPDNVVATILEELGLDNSAMPQSVQNSANGNSLLENQEFTTLSAVQVRGEIKNLNGQAQAYLPYLSPFLQHYPQYLSW